MARSSANSASMEMPTRRNGKDTSHTKGQRKMARMASGQHNTNNRHHTTNKSMVFTGVPYLLQAILPYLSVCRRSPRRSTIWPDELHLPLRICRRGKPELRVKALRIRGAEGKADNRTQFRMRENPAHQ